MPMQSGTRMPGSSHAIPAIHDRRKMGMCIPRQPPPAFPTSPSRRRQDERVRVYRLAAAACGLQYVVYVGTICTCVCVCM